MILYKSRCPACAEKGKDKHGDNLAVYADGHTYCYSCGYYTSNNYYIKQPKKQTVSIALPEDITTNIPDKAQKWLYQYIDKVNTTLFYSQEKNYLIFPIYGKSRDIIAWIARYFGTNTTHPKWIGRGINSHLFNPYGEHSKNIVLTEDIVSAMKVGHINYAMPLFGAHIKATTALRLTQLLQTHKIYLWLDYDKADYSRKTAIELSSLGIPTYAIVTKLDPKEYPIDEIQKILNEHMNELSLSNQISFQQRKLQ